MTPRLMLMRIMIFSRLSMLSCHMNNQGNKAKKKSTTTHITVKVVQSVPEPPSINYPDQMVC